MLTTTQDTVSLLAPLMLAALVAVTGCGRDEPAAPAAPSPTHGPDTGSVAPGMPTAGVEVIVVRSHETLPSLHAAGPDPLTDEDAYAAVQPRLITAQALAEHPDALRCEVVPNGGGVRFWIERGDTIDEERAVTLASALAEDFLASAQARFEDRVAVALLGLGKQLQAVSAQRSEAQQTLRQYLEVNRGAPETRETRREQAELERELSVVNTRASEIQDLIVRLENMQERGQPWYRRKP